MPRRARVVLPDVALHVTQRGHDGADCFFRPADYLTYLRYLKCYAAQHGCSIHAYCLMTNHVHLLLTPTSGESCARMMKQLGQCYVQTVNMALGRSGTLWGGRFYSCLVPTPEYVLACYRYIELNPVRAHIVASAADYRWSSFKGNAFGIDDGVVVPHPAVEALGAAGGMRYRAYRDLFDVPLSDSLVQEIRACTRDGRRLGLSRKPRGRAKRQSAPVSAEMGSVPIN